MTRFAASLTLAGLVLVSAGPIRAAESTELKSLLSHQIVGSTLPMVEVQRYCEARVPHMPEVKTVAEWEAEAARIREAVLDEIVYRGEAAGWRDAKMRVEWLQTIEGGPGYRIKKLRYECLPGLWVPALLYEPEQLTGKVPAVLNVNGHSHEGKQYPPKQIRCINQAKRGILALNVEWVGMGQLRSDGFAHQRMDQLNLCGTSGLAPFYLDMKRGLDLLLSLEQTDPDRVAVTGLSGGGWQTIILSSLDTRVRLCTPVAGYSSYRTRAYHLKDLGDSEQTPTDLATICDYTHLTAMLAPRPTLLTYNSKDNCCFESGYALEPLVKAARPVFTLYGRQHALRTHVNDDPGTHNYEVDNRQAFYRMLGDFFYPGDASFDPAEIPSDDEVKTAEELFVELPADNEDFNTLALKLCRQLPRREPLPKQKAAALKWQQNARAELREVVRAKDCAVHAVRRGEATEGEVKATFWELQMDGAWTVPAVELVRGEPEQTAIVVADEGRTSTAAEAARLLDAGYRVVALDPFYFGESQITQRGYLFALLLACVGDRPLGLQAGQVAAAARWLAGERELGPVRVVAIGNRSGTFSLVAGALETKAIAALELHDPLGSLKEVIENNWGVSQKPELFCFGFLEAFDVKHLAALVAPRPLRLVAPSDRAKAELGELTTWYTALGVDSPDRRFSLAPSP